MKIAVLDVTHAGGVLAEHYALAGHDVTAIDVYHTATEKPEGYTLTQRAAGNFELVVAPVHLPARYLEKIHAQRYISHHEAVGELLREMNLSTPLIEVTGTRSKTTTALILKHLLQSKYRVVVNTSAGLFYNDRKITHLSIAPGNVLQAVKLTQHLRPDFYIFEISLGGTTTADYGVLTTLEKDYLIAEETKSAGDAKIQTLFGRNTHPIAHHNSLEKITEKSLKPRLPLTSFGSRGDNVYIQHNTLHYSLKHCSGSLRLPEFFDPESYKTGIEAAVATALQIMNPEEVQEALLTFTAAAGRMQIERFSGRLLIDNSNSGVRAEELDRLLEKASRHGRVFLIHGEDGAVCERLNLEVSRAVLTRWKHRLLGAALIGFSAEGFCTAGSMEEAFRIALQHTTTDDVILSHVKCFR
jgi:UDP-N-acetylmuramyl pentapeptide synthase